MTSSHFGIIYCSLMLVALGSGQFYGTYGRDVLIRPRVSQASPYSYYQSPFPTASRISTPLTNRANIDVPQNIQSASIQISRGSEMFSFDMFRVSIFLLKMFNSYHFSTICRSFFFSGWKICPNSLCICQ